ncbi:TorD/DmsD family molecular chaperone [Rubneribacter sp.]
MTDEREEAREAGCVDEQIAAALEGRRSFYDLLAALYFRPLSAEQVKRCAEFDWARYAEVNERFAAGANDVRRYLRKRNTGTRQELAVDFTGSFGGMSAWEGRCAVPYESVFTSEDGLMYQESYHEVHTLFRESGVARAEGYDYPDDHLSFMFEYLGVLSGRMEAGVRDGAWEEVLNWAETSARFVDEHILTWFADFEEVALQLVKTRFYRGILGITEGFLRFDRELLNDVADVARLRATERAEVA